MVEIDGIYGTDGMDGIYGTDNMNLMDGLNERD